MKRVLCLFGTRPEIIKLAPVLRALDSRTDRFEVVRVASSQHTSLLHPFARHFGISFDRDLDVMNSIAAAQAGAHRLHATALGIGERCGNTSMDLLLVNLKLWGAIDQDLRKLYDYVKTVSEACQVPIPKGYPVFGADAFETATGVHAAAVIKAFKKQDPWLANRVYSGVPADEFGRAQKISIGHMSGRSNVLFWLEEHDIPATDELIGAIFSTAKQSNRLLTDAEILEVVRTVPAAPK